MTGNIIERAFEPAQSSHSRTLENIRRGLSRERFAGVDAHLAGAGIRSQLKLLMRHHRAEPIPAPVRRPAGAAGDQAAAPSRGE